MKIAIAGAGAIGAYLGAKLVQAGFDVYFIARGPHLDAMKKNGLKIIDRGGENFVLVPCLNYNEDHILLLQHLVKKYLIEK